MWNETEIKNFFLNHRTIRKYKAQPIPPSHLDLIFFAAQRAPTDATAQMASVVHLKDQKLKSEVASLSGNAHISTAPEAFVLCADVYRLAQILKTKGVQSADWKNVAHHFAIGDAVLMGQNMLLCAEMLGYQGCWIGGVLTQIEAISQLLRLPDGVLPFAGLTLGLADEEPILRPRLSKQNVIFENGYAENFIQLDNDISNMGTITARGDWVQTLSRYFEVGGSMEKREKEYKEFIDKHWFTDKL